MRGADAGLPEIRGEGMKLFIFPDPLDATCVLTHDTGPSFTGQPDVHPVGRLGQSFELPASIPDSNGAQLEISADGKVPLRQRGVLMTANSPLGNLAAFLADDFRLPNGAGRFL
jgi:hypothetical protein